MEEKEVKKFREDIIGILMKNYGYSRDDARVILSRIGARLDGHSHNEVKAMYPLKGEDLNE